MSRAVRCLTLLLLAATAASCAHVRPQAALPPALAPVHDRTTGRAIARDLDAIDQWEARLATSPRAAADPWRTAAAHAWFAAAREEYTDNDRTGFASAAFGRGVALVGELERAVAPVDSGQVPAPFVPAGSARVGDALRATLDSLVRNPGFHCAREPLARMEVELAWAGNESLDQGTCNVQPHLDRAAALAREARELVERCVPPPAPAPVATPVPEPEQAAPPPSQVPTAEELRIPKNVHFALDQWFITADSWHVIANIAALLQKYPSITVRLVGHADSRGSVAHNLALSRKRVNEVRAALLQASIDSVRISTDYKGKADLYAIEASKRDFALNRRVDFVFVDPEGHDIRAEAQEGDLQLEQDRPAPKPKPAVTPARRPAAKPGTGVKRPAVKRAAAKATATPSRVTTPKRAASTRTTTTVRRPPATTR